MITTDTTEQVMNIGMLSCNSYNTVAIYHVFLETSIACIYMYIATYYDTAIYVQLTNSVAMESENN